jgi:hypothetical protein
METHPTDASVRESLATGTLSGAFQTSLTQSLNSVARRQFSTVRVAMRESLSPTLQ